MWVAVAPSLRLVRRRRTTDQRNKHRSTSHVPPHRINTLVITQIRSEHLLRPWRSLVVRSGVVWTHGCPRGSGWSRRTMWAWTSMWTRGAMRATHWSDGSLKTHQRQQQRQSAHNRKVDSNVSRGDLLSVSHPDLLLHQLPGVVDLLR